MSAVAWPGWPRRHRQIRHQRLELRIRARREGDLEPFLELRRREPAVAGGGAQALGHALAVRVGYEQLGHRKYWPWKPNGMWCGASARATSSKEPASSTSRNERPAFASSTTDSTTPSSSPSLPGSRTKTGSPG